MSGPFGSSQWMYSSGGFYDFPIEQSLKFNDDDSSYLSWTPASAGNRKTWTWSGWVKRGNINTSFDMLNVGDGAGFVTALRFTNEAVFQFQDFLSASYNLVWGSSAVFRDPSAWYHVVFAYDSTQATSSAAATLWVNGVQQTLTLTAFNGGYVQNRDGYINDTRNHTIGRYYGSAYADGYLAEVNFIDGTALDASSFGEFKSGVWIPKDPSGLSYGTNGFRLSFQNDTVSEGFNAVTYRGTGATQSINGIGFAPDLVWCKTRTAANDHNLSDSVRGATKFLHSNKTDAEATYAGAVVSFDSDGFTVGDGAQLNQSGQAQVAWCWDAGSGSPVSNTSGSITSTVKANAAYGFSIISYTGAGSTATVGHGLSSAPEMIIIKNRTAPSGYNWNVYHASLGNTQRLLLDSDTAAISGVWNNTSPTSSVFTIGGSAVYDSGDYIAYAFHSVAGYSKVGSFVGTGAAGNTVTLGFRPAFIMVKVASAASDWTIIDNTRNTSNPLDKRLNPNFNNAETTNPVYTITDTGFTSVGGAYNGSGATMVYIAFADTRDNAFWRDQSGNGNDWQPNNLTYQDSLPDGTNNFCTLNPLDTYGGAWTLSEGNLKGASSAVNGCRRSTMSVSSGKYYWEVYIADDLNYHVVGVSDQTCNGWATTPVGGSATGVGWFYAGRDTSPVSTDVNANTSASYGTSFAVGDIVGVALDMDAGTIEFYKNGASQGVAYSNLSGYTLSPTMAQSSGSVMTDYYNFGQDGSFAGNKPAQGNTDDNGYGDFYYPVPSGYLALCSANLPSPVIDPAQDDVPSDYFETKLYTGNGSTQSITGLTFQPDWVWIKNRSNALSHAITDAVRGNTLQLSSNSTGADQTTTDGITSFNSDGFSLGAGTQQYSTNTSGHTYVAWNWLAGNGTSSNTAGSITSTVSVNEKAGFSIIGYTGNATAGATIGHSLGVAPSMLIFKNRDVGRNWVVYLPNILGVSSSDYLMLDQTGAKGFAGAVNDLNNTAPSSSVITLGDDANTNESTRNFICYAFAEIPSYSKFGSYTGNGSTDGPFVYTGFRPAFLIIKRTDSANWWQMYDAARNQYNVVDKYLGAQSSDAEYTASSPNDLMDFLSNGFKVRGSNPAVNASGGTYIFMAFAENPFKYANAR